MTSKDPKPLNLDELRKEIAKAVEAPMRSIVSTSDIRVMGISSTKMMEIVFDIISLFTTYTEQAVLEARNAKDNAYWERDQLVAFLSKIYPSWIGWHLGEWEDDWRNIVYVELPTGQVSWHIHSKELSNFTHLKQDFTKKWDGHTTEEKYKRLNKLNSQEKDRK